MKVINIASHIKSKFLDNAQPQLDYVEWKGMRLPLPKNRFCTIELQDNEYYVNSTKYEVDRLIEYANLKPGARVLDIGSGQGRLAIGLSNFYKGKLNCYFGIDVDRFSVEWCKRNISALNEGFNFLHLDVENERYNPNGYKLHDPIQLPFKADSFDVVFLYSVFTHMRSDDIQYYLNEISRMLSTDGRVFFTAYSEDTSENEAINPQGYLEETFGKSLGALHRVRFSHNFWKKMIDDAGLQIHKFFHQCEERTNQSVYVLKLK